VDKKSKATLRALKAIKTVEQQTQMFKKIRQTLHPFVGGSVSRVEVPSDLALEVESFQSVSTTPGAIETEPLSNLEHILQRTIKT
jgi:hypothetical protein